MESKKTHKIIIATGIFPPSIGGPATYSKMLADELPRFGIAARVLSFDDVRRWPKGIRHFIYFWKLYELVRDFDLIYAQDPVSVGYPAMLCAKLSGKPLFLRLGGDYAWEQACQKYGVTDLLDTFLENKKLPPPVRRLQRIQKKVAQYAKEIVVPSQYLKSIVVRWGIAPEKIAVIPNTIEGALPTEDKPALRSELNIKTKVIMSAGRLVPWKGFAALINGLADFIKEKNMTFVIAGTGPDKALLAEAIVRHDLSDRVFLLGALSRRDLLRYLKASDVFVLDTAYEGFSHQVLEAMALGTPVVTTAVGGNPELLEDGTHGFLVALNDIEAFKAKITLLLEDTELAQAIRSRARERTTIFAKEGAVTSLIALLP